MLHNTFLRLLGEREPWIGSTADLFVQTRFPLHSGRILISIIGLVVAMLSVTGVIIWLRKRNARRRVQNESRSPSGTNRFGTRSSQVGMKHES